MRDALLATATSKRLANLVREAVNDVLKDRDPQVSIEKAEAEFVKLASAMGYAVMKVPEVGR